MLEHLKIKFICIDCRYQKDGHWYTVLESGQHLILPNNLSGTPFLLVLCDNYKTIMGPKPILKYFENKLNEQKRKTKYLKSRSEIIQYKDFHEIKDNYKEKYREKDSYTAILIPESGSWIRFTFKKNSTK